jgi:hypothetical protein
MADGKSLGILQHIREIAKTATPQDKLEPTGMLASLLMAHSPGVVKNDSYDGHFKTVKVKHLQRFTKAQTATTASCDVTNTQPYLENTVSVASYRQIAVHIEDELIAAYDSYMSQGAGSGTTNTMTRALYDAILSAANAILDGVNSDVITLATAALGYHRATGNASAVTVNFPLSTASNPLNGAANKLKSDFLYNNMKGAPIVIGGGLFGDWMLQQPAKGLDSSGLMTNVQAAGFNFFFDYQLGTSLSQANDILIYEKDAIQLVEYMKYQGFKAGVKPGASEFGIMPIPTNDGKGGLAMVKFDYQLMYNDCEQEFSYVDGVADQVLQKGWNLILSKNFGLWTVPTNAYRSGDVLAGNRGSLRYRITNS